MIKVSVVVPIYNKEKYLSACLDSIINQTLTALEIICIDDGSTDSSLSILNKYADKDRRISIITQENAYAGVARNNGIKIAKGEYIAFVDADDYIPLDFFEVLYETAKINGADVVRCPYKYCYEDYLVDNLYNNLLKIKFDEHAELLAGHHSIVVWNAIYKLSFLKEHNIVFQETKHANDVLFSTKVSCYAKKSLPVLGIYYFHRRNVAGQLTTISKERIYEKKHVNDCVFDFLLSQTTKYLRKADFSYLLSLCLNRYIAILTNVFSEKNIHEKERKKFFLDISKKISNNVVVVEKLNSSDSIVDEKVYFHRNMFNIILNKEYESYKKYYNREIVVSLTSYPERISTVHKTILSLFYQNMASSKILLWLAESQFPNRENDLPQNLLELKEQGLEILWCEDIKSYKKLIPTLKLYPEAIIVTADDDIVYPVNWLQNLYNEYKKNPKMIHAYRVRKIKYNNNKCILPYEQWELCYKRVESSYNLLPTGCGGILYPANCFHKDILKEDIFMSLAPYGDDLWFWAMAVLNSTKINIPIIPEVKLNIIEGSQDVALWKENVFQGRNDTQFSNILERYPRIKQMITSEDLRLNKLNTVIPYSYQGFDSTHYWKSRYADGGNSGAGSYGRLAEFKAEVINRFCDEKKIESVIEFGSGDGNNLLLYKFKEYIGVDVSLVAIDKAKEIFLGDKSKRFISLCDYKGEQAELSLSLDVIYHLVEDDTFSVYMNNLFNAAKAYVIIYASNKNEETTNVHVRHRKFTDWIEKNVPNWAFDEIIRNKYPFDPAHPTITSFSDFYIYKKIKG